MTVSNRFLVIAALLTSDARTRARFVATGIPIVQLEKLEAAAICALHEYDQRRRSLASAMEAINEYDSLPVRSGDYSPGLVESYERTLESRVWGKCDCPICTATGIDVVIFRGCNRNKRRGAHNTLVLYKRLGTK